MRALLVPVALAAALLSGCPSTSVRVLPAPIPVELSGGALVARGTVDDLTPSPFPLLIDTGSPVTAWDDGMGGTRAHVGLFRLFSVEPNQLVPRIELENLRLYTAPIGSLGTGGGVALGGVFGGDQLQRWAVSLDYRVSPTQPSPRLAVRFDLLPCPCELANQCQAVFPFLLAGGGHERPISVGDDVFTYPATRILLDVCLEPRPDPVRRGLPCATQNACDFLDPAYLPSGVEVKVLLATGFPGFALSKGAFERLRGADAVKEAFDHSVQLALPDLPDGEITVGTAILGGADLAALALVSREGRFGPCSELARSRRQRRVPPGQAGGESGCLVQPDLPGCAAFVRDFCPPDTCDDTNADTAAVIELGRPVPAWILSDTAPILLGINADVRPQNPAVEGIVGTEVLARLVATIDYPHRRLVARCSEPEPGCLTYPQFLSANSATGCRDDTLCAQRRQAAMPQMGGGLCPPVEPLP